MEGRGLRALAHALPAFALAGGGDAAVVREFDLATRSFIKDGFTLAEAKSSITYLDEDTVLVATDFGAGSMTTSGYARIVKSWRARHTPDPGAYAVRG